MWKQKMIVVLTMILNNYICEHISGDIDFEHVERDEYYKLTIPEGYNKYVVSRISERFLGPVVVTRVW
jgi:hypothetical protein